MNATGVIFWKGFMREGSKFISLISEEKSRDIMQKSGKLLSELAFTYIYFNHMSYSQVSKIFENLFTKT